MAKPLGGVAGILTYIAKFLCPLADPVPNPPAIFAHAPVHLSTFPASLGCLTSPLGGICISWISHCTSHGAAISAAAIIPGVRTSADYCGASATRWVYPKVHPSTGACWELGSYGCHPERSWWLRAGS